MEQIIRVGYHPKARLVSLAPAGERFDDRVRRFVKDGNYQENAQFRKLITEAVNIKQ
jgi:hypothetical protein